MAILRQEGLGAKAGRLQQLLQLRGIDAEGAGLAFSHPSGDFATHGTDPTLQVTHTGLARILSNQPAQRRVGDGEFDFRQSGLDQLGLSGLELGSMGGMQMFWIVAGALIALAAAGVMKLSQEV